jgi:hypothetical protein
MLQLAAATERESIKEKTTDCLCRLVIFTGNLKREIAIIQGENANRSGQGCCRRER